MINLDYISGQYSSGKYKFNDLEGLASLIPLDYDSRYEHSVIVVPTTWESMFHLIKDPTVAMQSARKSFLTTPHYTSYYGQVSMKRTVQWTLNNPITVLLSPLTIPTSQTIGILETLTPYYPFRDAISHATSWPVDKFKREVMRAAQSPNATPANLVGNVIGPIDEAGLVSYFPQSPNSTWTPFDLQYVAEFAVQTGILTIHYIPRTSPVNRVYKGYITTSTIGHLCNTFGAVLHFDVDFGKATRTKPEVAMARAALAMDYIADAAGLITDLVHNRQNSLANTNYATPQHEPNVHYSGAQHFVASNSTNLIQSPYQDKAPGLFRNRIDPTVVIDGVWPNSAMGGGGNSPLVCSQITLQQYLDGNGNPVLSDANHNHYTYNPTTQTYQHNGINATVPLFPVYDIGEGVFKYYVDLVGAGEIIKNDNDFEHKNKN